MALVGTGLSGTVAVFTVMVSGWFVTRIHKLETRVETLEMREHALRRRERQLEDFIYRNGLRPPPAKEVDDD